MSESPVAGRLRRPTWKDPRLLVGALLIVVSVVGVSALVRAADDTVAFYTARDTLVPGTVLSKDDVAVVHVRVPGGTYVEVGDEPWGHVVTRVIDKGELLPQAALSTDDAQHSRVLAVTAAQPLAEGIEAGSLVDVYVTQVLDADASTTLIASELVVDSVDRDAGSFGSTTSEVVYLVVPVEQVEDFLSATALDGEITVVGPGGGG